MRKSVSPLRLPILRLRFRQPQWVPAHVRHLQPRHRGKLHHVPAEYFQRDFNLGTSSEAASTLTGKLLGLSDAFYKALTDTATATGTVVATIKTAKKDLADAYNRESAALKQTMKLSP